MKQAFLDKMHDIAKMPHAEMAKIPEIVELNVMLKMAEKSKMSADINNV